MDDLVEILTYPPCSSVKPQTLSVLMRSVVPMVAVSASLLGSVPLMHSFLSKPSKPRIDRIRRPLLPTRERSIAPMSKVDVSSREIYLAETPGMSDADARFVSLASSYRIDISSSPERETWSLVPITAIKGAPVGISEGAQAKRALMSKESTDTIAAILQCVWDGGDSLVVSEVDESNVDSSLVATLSRIMAQRLASHHENASKEWTVLFPDDSTVITESLISEAGVRTLFESILDSSNVELVDMVARDGTPLGIVPRPLIHSFNLLHRGIGMVVTKDAMITASGVTEFPPLYVHRRTDTKRIFPSLYDMFVGGISTTGEDAKTTAAREVAEELGIERALTDPNALSSPLFDCIVTTSYNRCVVTVFCFQFDSLQDSIAWQKEEVAWGDFVPYSVVESSARLCIQRMVSLSGYWPGESPYALTLDSRPVDRYGNADDWIMWDYVPDGLLVWEAWLRWQNGDLDS